MPNQRRQPWGIVLFTAVIVLAVVATACSPAANPTGSNDIVSADERVPTQSLKQDSGTPTTGAVAGEAETAAPGDRLSGPDETVEPEGLNQRPSAPDASAIAGTADAVNPNDGLSQPSSPLTNITVNSLADATDPTDGVCTLREAIRAANSDTASGGLPGECLAGSGADAITFSVTGTIVSAGGTFQVNNTLSILGPGARNLTINGSGRRVFKVNDGVTFNLQDVAITNGGSGGATSVSFGGGAIWNDRGAASVTNVTFLANSSGGVGSGHGGAIANGGTLTVRNSTFFNNVSPERGGAIFNFAGTDDAGTVYEGSAFIINSTVVSNTALTSRGGGIDNQDGLLVVVNSTIVGNHADESSGGGIDNSSLGEVRLRNTIVANNTALNGANCRNGGALNNLGGNLSFPDTTCPGVNADPNLGPLQDNGGPTDTLALPLDSPAVDTGVPLGADCIDHLSSTLTTDQRGPGFPRRVDGNRDGIATCDIGAYEAEAAPDLAVSKDDGRTTVRPGETLTYTLTISNVGTQSAAGALITDTLPLHTTFITASDGASVSGRVVTWPTFDLAAGAKVNRTLSVRVDDPLPAGVDLITNTVTVGPDRTPANNTASDTDVVEAAPDLAISKGDGQPTAMPGQTLTYTLAISNIGDQGATGVVAADTLPMSTTFVAASDGGSEASGIVTWPPFDLPAGASVTRTLTVKVDEPLPFDADTITNTASVADDGRNGPDPTPANNIATDVDVIVFECELYPIALHTSSLAGVPAGQVVPDIFNGSQPGNFGWLTWAGSPDVGALVTSLTPPGDSDTYVNPNNPGDHNVSIGDWVQGKPGVSNSSQVRAALDLLKTIEMVVPVWDVAQDSGGNAIYHVVNFAWVRLTDYRLPGQNRISARFLGLVRCAD